MYTKNGQEKRLRLFEFYMPYEYLSYKPNGKTSYYRDMTLNGYVEAYIKLSETPV